MAGLYWQPKNPALEGSAFSRPFLRFIEMVSRFLGWYAVEILFANVPPHPEIGELANISDATSAAPGATITGGGTNRVLGRWDGTQWVVVSGSSGGGGGVAPGAPSTSVQFNNAGNFGGSSLFTFASNRVLVDPSAAISGNTTLAVGNNYSTTATYAGFPSKAVFASDGNTTWQTAYVDTTSGPTYAGAISVYPESGVGVFELAGGLNGEAGFHLYPSDYPAATAAWLEIFGADVSIRGLRYPTADAPAGYVVTTDGAGTLSLQPSGGVGSTGSWIPLVNGEEPSDYGIGLNLITDGAGDLILVWTS